MTLIEVLIATMLLAFSGSATLMCMSSAAQMTTRIAQQAHAEDCAEDAAERWFAGQTIPPEYLVGGMPCRVEVVQDVQTQSVLIRASCGQAQTTLAIPQT